MRCLILMSAIFGMVYCGSSGETRLDYNPLNGPPQGAHGPAVVQNHGAMGNVVGARAGIKGGNSGGQTYDYPLYDGPSKSGTGPGVVQQHGYAGAPQVSGVGTGGSSQDNGNAFQGNNAVQNNGGSSQDNDGGGAGGAQIQPQIIPGGDDSGEGGNQVALTGGVPAQSGGTGGQNGMVGGYPAQSGGAAAGDSSNSIDGGVGGNQLGRGNNGAAPNAAPVAGGAEAGLILHRNDLQQSSGMSGAAVAGVVAGVVAVGAVGTAVAVVALKSSATPLLPA